MDQLDTTKEAMIEDMSFDDYDEIVNPKPEENDFDAVVDAAISRRGFLGVLAMGSVAALAGTTALTAPAAAANRFGFDAVAANTTDTITVPSGYKWHMPVKWGDAMWSDSVDFDDATRGTAATQARTVGDNNDGMDIFAIDNKQVLVLNNEYTNRSIIFGNRDSSLPETDDDVMKGKNAQGLTIVEIEPQGGTYSIVKDSPYNRRITADTPMELTGPAAGQDLLKTAADPTGTRSLGTWNDCGNGRTPWGTYLACEENFNGYFSAADEDHTVSDELKRYGVSSKDWGYGFAKVDERFDVSKHPNEPNRAGYVVEIDPLDPSSTPKKRTALGRFKHENAEVVVNGDGRIVVYMGDDERGEFLYRYVSTNAYTEGGDTDDLLNNGSLFVAKFNEDGLGKWLPLTPETTGMASQAEISIHTRQAASAVGATTMDRPEWVASNPVKAEVYCALTNNKNRGKKPNAGGDPTPAGGPNPREANKFGQIVRWRPSNADHTSDVFQWDLFVMAGNPAVFDDANDPRAGSPNLNAGNMFNSPDGITFDEKGLLWIQTDGNYKNEEDFAGQGNNQMLVADPVTGEIRRFLVGPNECEVTGMCWSTDRRTLFVGIQHPGERGNSHFPGGGTSVPRSGVVAIQREDGGVIG
ncbi:MAG: PhoX family phosphatase [Pseudomonadota bacterium]